MKKLLFLLAFVPFFANAQKLEISEQAGLCQSATIQTAAADNGETVHGFSNQVSAGYHVSRHFAINAFYEYEKPGTSINSFGLSPDYVTKHFFVGLDLRTSRITAQADQYSLSYVKYDQSFGYGLHAGAKQKIYKHLLLVEQVGFDMLHVKGMRHLVPDTWPGGTPPVEDYSFTQNVNIVYARVGLAYKL